VRVAIDPRFNGPPGSANGGYACGLVARLAGAPVEVTLRSPPPLARPLRWDGERLWDGETLVAEAAPAGPREPDVPPPVPWDEAAAATPNYRGFAEHPFPTCVVCGPERAPGDGLRIFASPVREGLVAATWAPVEEVPSELVWAALDCPGAFAVGATERGETVLGRMAAEIERCPLPGERCVVVAWGRGEEGRKLYAGTALYAGEELLAAARQTWIVPRD
jgi:hypothetical protein